MIQKSVRQLAAGLTAGHSARGVCPICEAAHENSFHVRVDPHSPWKLWYKCYRASCGVRGCVTEDGNITMSVAPDADHLTDRIAQTYHPISRDMLKSMSKEWGIPSVEVLACQGLRYDALSDTVAYPWTNFERQVGWHLRHREKKSIQMVRTVEGGKGYSCIQRVIGKDWRCGEAVVVESLRACYKLSGAFYKGVRCCPRPIALMGHVLPREAAVHWRQNDVRQALVLLDPDTWPSGSVNVLKTLEGAGIQATAMSLPTKPHQMSDQELREVISNIRF